jgi:hypothetical protein
MNQTRRQRPRVFVPVQIRRVDHPSGLLTDGFHNLRMVVTERIDGDSRVHVDVGVSVWIREGCSGAVGEGDVGLWVEAEEVVGGMCDRGGCEGSALGDGGEGWCW